MKLSIVIPVYNTASVLTECLDSIYMQDMDESDFEVIVVDDASPDNALEILSKYQKRHANLKVISQENGGISIARNTGMKKAVGEYTVLIDSDDFYSKMFFKELFNFIDKHNHPDLVLFNFNYYYQKDQKYIREVRHFNHEEIKNKSGKEALDYILEQDPMYSWYAWSFLVKTSIIHENDLYFLPKLNYEDMMWTPLLYLHANTIAYYEKEVLSYRLQRDGQITGTMSLKNLVDPLHAPQYIQDKIKNLNVNKNTEARLIRNLSNKFFIAFIYGSQLSKQDRLALIDALMKNANLLNYTSTTLTKQMRLVVKILGIKNTVNLFSILLPLYRKIKNR